jgi:hypothetical protein
MRSGLDVGGPAPEGLRSVITEQIAGLEGPTAGEEDAAIVQRDTRWERDVVEGVLVDDEIGELGDHGNLV